MRNCLTQLCLALFVIVSQAGMAAETQPPPAVVPPSNPGAPPSFNRLVPTAAHPAPGCEPAILVKPGAKSPPSLAGLLPVPDYLESLFDCVDLRATGTEHLYKPRSSWLETDAREYSEILARGQFSWLIVPVQTQSQGFDRIERALISADIADAFASHDDAPDTFLVARALGEMRRRYEPSAISALAARLGVTRVLEVFAGHDQNRHMTLTLILKDCHPGQGCAPVKQHDWRNVAFTNEQPPFLAVRNLRNELVSELTGGNARPPHRAVSAGKGAALDLSNLESGDTQADPALVSSVVASLVPSHDELGRERLQTIALRDALNAAPTAANRVRAAHAAYCLHRRPYALKLLEGLKDPAAMTLRQLLNGNLPEAQEAVARINAPDLKMILSFDVQDLRIRYDRPAEFDGSVGQRVFSGEGVWSSIVERRASDYDWWAAADGATPKLLLDAALPIPGQDMGSVLKGLRVVGKESEGFDPLLIASLRHLHQAQGRLVATECCSASGPGAKWAVYWLAESIVNANFLKATTFQLDVQGNPDVAWDMLREFEAFYSGQPSYEVLRFQTADALSKLAPNEMAAHLKEQADTAELSAAYWSQGQSSAANDSVMRRSDTQLLRAAYGADYPGRSWWTPSAVMPSTASAFCDALPFSTVDFHAAVCLPFQPPAKQPAMRADLAGRFHGNAQAVAYLKQIMPPVAGADPVRDLRASIAQDPETWDNYLDLGRLLLRRDANYAEAQRVYLAYPAFHRKSHNEPVRVSNAAYDVGSELYWRGQFELARPLYEIAADLHTGSNASITSQIRLDLLDGNYEAAAHGSLMRAQRYPNPYAYRDYLSLLHVLGHGAEADAGFHQIAESFDNAAAWLAPMVGQRMRSMTPGEFKVWILGDDIREAHFRGRRYAPIYALWWMTTDRKPTPDFAETMRRIEKDAIRPVESDGISFTRPHPSEEGMMQMVRRSPFANGKSGRMAPYSNAPSEYLLLANALVPLYSGDYETAVQQFVLFSDRYPIELEDTAVALSYFALAAAKSGAKIGLEEYVETIPNADTNYDVWLARAYFAAVKRDSDKAIKALIRAVNVRPHTDSRPIVSEYQYVEACETVLRETRDERLRPMIVDWARRFQRVHPMYAWAYAVEAQYSQNPLDVTRAAAIALYLDPASPRLAGLDATRLAAARVWLKANNPFLKEREARRQVPST